MPPVGKIIDRVNFSNLYIQLDQKANEIPSGEEAEKPVDQPAPTNEESLLIEIRDALKTLQLKETNLE